MNKLYRVYPRLLNIIVSKERLNQAIKEWNKKPDKCTYCELGSPSNVRAKDIVDFFVWNPNNIVCKIVNVIELEDESYEFDIELNSPIKSILDYCESMLSKDALSLVPRCMGNENELTIYGFDLAPMPAHYEAYNE